MAKKYFREQKNGYDKEQVDNYIRKLIETFERTYKEYLDTYDKYCILSSEVNESGRSVFQ